MLEEYLVFLLNEILRGARLTYGYHESQCYLHNNFFQSLTYKFIKFVVIKTKILAVKLIMCVLRIKKISRITEMWLKENGFSGNAGNNDF